MLAKAGAPLLQKDSAGLTPLDHALIRGAPRITRMLQELTGVDKAKLVSFLGIFEYNGIAHGTAEGNYQNVCYILILLLLYFLIGHTS